MNRSESDFVACSTITQNQYNKTKIEHNILKVKEEDCGFTCQGSRPCQCLYRKVQTPPPDLGAESRSPTVQVHRYALLCIYALQLGHFQKLKLIV